MLVQTLTVVVYIMYVWCGVVWCGVVGGGVGWGVYVLYVCMYMYAGKQAGMYMFG